MEKLKLMKLEWVDRLPKIKKQIQTSSTWINHTGSAQKNEVLQSWIQSIIKACFHMSGKSQTIGDFTVSKLSQILPTNENSKSQISPIVWDGQGQIGRIGSVSIFPTRPRFLRWSVIIPDKWKFKSLPSGRSAMDFTHYQSPKLLGSSPPNRDRLLAIIRYIGKIRDVRQKVKSPIVWDFRDIWKPGFISLVVKTKREGGERSFIVCSSKKEAYLRGKA